MFDYTLPPGPHRMMTERFADGTFGAIIHRLTWQPGQTSGQGCYVVGRGTCRTERQARKQARQVLRGRFSPECHSSAVNAFR